MSPVKRVETEIEADRSNRRSKPIVTDLEQVRTGKGKLGKAPLDLIECERAQQQMKIEWFLVKFICAALAVCSIGTLAIFFLEGFQTGGFKLSDPVLHWIGAATVGEIGTLATMVYSAFFKNSGGRR